MLEVFFSPNVEELSMTRASTNPSMGYDHVMESGVVTDKISVPRLKCLRLNGYSKPAIYSIIERIDVPRFTALEVFDSHHSHVDLAHMDEMTFFNIKSLKIDLYSFQPCCNNLLAGFACVDHLTVDFVEQNHQHHTKLLWLLETDPTSVEKGVSCLPFCRASRSSYLSYKNQLQSFCWNYRRSRSG
jgi:hypothetical protein